MRSAVGYSACEIDTETNTVRGKEKARETEREEGKSWLVKHVDRRGISPWRVRHGARAAPRRVGAGARRSYDVASYITLRPLTKDSWWDGSLQDRIIWVVICRRRCWFFGRVCCRVRVRPPAAKDPTGPSWALLFLPSPMRLSSPATTVFFFFFF